MTATQIRVAQGNGRATVHAVGGIALERDIEGDSFVFEPKPSAAMRTLVAIVTFLLERRSPLRGRWLNCGAEDVGVA
jgi:hypothetical protein